LEVVVCAGGEGARAGEDGVGLVGGDLADELEAEAAVGSWGVVLVRCMMESLTGALSSRTQGMGEADL